MDKQSILIVTFLLILLFFVSSIPSLSAEKNGVILGFVTDSTTKKPMRFATIRIDGIIKKGAITNAAGFYRTELPAGSYTIQCSMVGFRSALRKVDLQPGDTLRLNIILAEESFTTRELIVTAEDPAVRLMRIAIERKMKQRDSLNTYTYMLYTKLTASSDTITAQRSDSREDTTIFGVLETYSKGYFQKPDKYFNQIIQRRQTTNFPPQANMLVIGTNLNAYDDEIQLLDEQIVSPFHPDALDFYSFEMAGETESEGRNIARLKFTPKTSQRKLFEGIILLDKDNFAPVSVDLRPNKSVQTPFDAKIAFRQHFIDIHGKFIAPSELSLDIGLNLALMFVANPRLDFSIETIAYDYTLNPALDADLFEMRPIEVSPVADVYDSTYWASRAIMPLRPEEAAAYIAIKTQVESDSLQASAASRNPLALVSREIGKLFRRPFTGFDDVFRYNRVNGAYLGFGLKHNISPFVEVRGGLGYGFSDKRLFGWGGATFYFDTLRKYSFGASSYNKLARTDANSAISESAVTLLSLAVKNDYADYYYAKGYELFAEANFGQLHSTENDLFERPTSYKIFYRNEYHTPARANAQFAIFDNESQFRDNPAAIAGMLRSFGTIINWDFNLSRRIGSSGLRFEAEIADPSILPTDFSFSQFRAAAYFRTRTLPLWRLDAKLSAGLSKGNIPPQRFFSLESSVSGTATEGVLRGLGVKEFYGDRFAALSIEHNFGEIIPGILRIPNIAPFGLEFLLTGGIAYTSFLPNTTKYSGISLASTSSTNDKFYYEAGLGVNRILLLFRMDVTARISQRLAPQFFFTISTFSF